MIELLIQFLNFDQQNMNQKQSTIVGSMIHVISKQNTIPPDREIKLREKTTKEKAIPDEN